MLELPLALPSAVAIIETPEHFLMEGRPNLPGKLSHPGMVQLFGGHINMRKNVPVESALAAVCREIGEELGLYDIETPEHVWSGVTRSENRYGEVSRRPVSLFHLYLADESGVAMQIPGEIVRIPKCFEDITAYRSRLTPFAFKALVCSVVVRPGE